MQPEDAIAAENLLSTYVGLNRMSDARAEMERAQKLGLDTSTLDRTVRLQTFFLLGDTNGVQRIMTQVAGQPVEFLATEALAGTQLFSGEFRKAAATTQQAFDQAGVAKAPDVQANALLTNAASRGYAGLCEDNEKAVQRALDLDRSRQTQSFALLTAGICGDGKLVASMAQELARKFPEDTMIQRVFVPLAKDFCSSFRGPAQELSTMQTRPSHLPWFIRQPTYRVSRICSFMKQARPPMPFDLPPSLQAVICTPWPLFMRRRNWGWRGPTPWAAIRRMPKKRTRLFSLPGKTPMQICPCS